MQNSDLQRSAIKLTSMTSAQLERIADHPGFPDSLETANDAALVPPHVARRSLDTIRAGSSPTWCAPFLVMREHDLAIVGSCGFKGPPEQGNVEVGYSVSPNFRNQGLATAAVRALLEIASTDESVKQVLATINPINLESTRVVEKIGFERGESFFDTDGEELVRWTLRINAPAEQPHSFIP